MIDSTWDPRSALIAISFCIKGCISFSLSWQDISSSFFASSSDDSNSIDFWWEISASSFDDDKASTCPLSSITTTFSSSYISVTIWIWFLTVSRFSPSSTIFLFDSSLSPVILIFDSSLSRSFSSTPRNCRCKFTDFLVALNNSSFKAALTRFISFDNDWMVTSFSSTSADVKYSPFSSFSIKVSWTVDAAFFAFLYWFQVCANLSSSNSFSCRSWSTSLVFSSICFARFSFSVSSLDATDWLSITTLCFSCTEFASFSVSTEDSSLNES